MKSLSFVFVLILDQSLWDKQTLQKYDCTTGKIGRQMMKYCRAPEFFRGHIGWLKF